MGYVKHVHMRCIDDINPLPTVIWELYRDPMVGDIEGDTRSLDCSSMPKNI